ncbi:type II secretion system protein [Yoonia sediminilitoris]|nr:type II secretion system protein [Yoonia sediminilitoris]
MSKAGRTDGGYTYVALLVVLVGITLAAQTTFVPTATKAKRATEAEIIFQGRAYRDAIARYWAFDEEPAFPSTLDDLLRDPRDPGVKHIRRLYDVDNWTAEFRADGGIQGVFPDRRDMPLKQAGFPPDLADFEGKKSYKDWVFRFVPDPAPSE